MNAPTIRIAVEFADDCADVIADWYGSVCGPDIDHARRFGATVAARNPGAIAALFVWCDDCGRWEDHDDAVCAFCSSCRCEKEMNRTREERGEQLCESCEDDAAGEDCDCYGGCVRCVCVSATGPI